MGNNDINNLLIPTLPKTHAKSKTALKDKLSDQVQKDEFKNLLSNQVQDLEKKTEGEDIKLSLHAAKRMRERDIEIDSDEYLKLKEALSKLKHKGGQDSLVVTNKAAYIIDVNNSTVVTAMDKDNMAENVITKIDSTMIMG